jgi:hypothetical protein
LPTKGAISGVPVARPAAIEQVTICPVAVQPAGNVPIVSVDGMLSVTVATAVVAVEPMLVTVSV